MVRIAAFVLATTLATAGLGIAVPALADACYGQQQTQQMVQQRQIISLSNVLGQINAIGTPVSSPTSPELCGTGSALFYNVDVLKNGSVVHLRIDARSGAISQ